MSEFEPDFQQHVIGTLARIETKLDANRAELDDHEARLRKVERAKNLLWGAAGVVGAGVTAAIDWLRSNPHHL